MAAFDFAKVKDPTFFKENVLNAHASFRTYASREEYRTGSSSLALKLDGIWKFAYAKNYTSAIPGFEKTDYDCSGWDDIHVPAHIQMEGYDIPQYANVQYPWDGREEVQPGEIPQRFNPVASYVKYFELPESMQGKPVHIEFEGVESGMALWLNGSYVGYTEDSFSAHAFDLTPYLQPGVNKLAVQVFKWTSSSWCEDQDFFRFSGIFRSVWLYAIPTVHLEDISVKTLFAGDDFTHSTLEVALQVEGKGAARLTLRRSELEMFSEKIALNGGSAMFSYAVENPHLWSAEDPALYELEIELLDDAGHLVEVTGQKVGFRKFELKNKRNLPTRRTAAIRAALSGITSTSPFIKKTATASGSKPTAATSVSVLPTIISAEMALPTVVTVLLLPRCRRSSSAIRTSPFPSATLALKSGTRTCSPLRVLSTALHCCIVMESCISSRN